MTTVDISMFDTDAKKLALFYTLINKSTGGCHSQFMTLGLSFEPTHESYTQYEHTLNCIKTGWIDRFNGRVFKGNISGKEFDTFGYNRDNGGQGTAENIIKELREIMKI